MKGFIMKSIKDLIFLLVTILNIIILLSLFTGCEISSSSKQDKKSSSEKNINKNSNLLNNQETTPERKEIYYPPIKDHSSLAGYSSTFGCSFNPTNEPLGGGEGYSKLINESTVKVNNKENLITALRNSEKGDIIYIDDSAEIDLSDGGYPLILKEGVTLASGRGKTLNDGTVSKGALLKVNVSGANLIRAAENNARVTGLRIDGSDYEVGKSSYEKEVTCGINSKHYNIEVDNNEIMGWTWNGVYCGDGYIHHNFIHDNTRTGLGYGVLVHKSNHGTLIEGNIFNRNRHSIASAGKSEMKYEARYNLVLEQTKSHAFDMHGQNNGTLGGDWIKIHHNTYHMGTEAFFLLRGKPSQGFYAEYNWFYNNMPNKALTQASYCAEGNIFIGNNKYGHGQSVSYHNGTYYQRSIELYTKKVAPVDYTQERVLDNEFNSLQGQKPGDYVTYGFDISSDGVYAIEVCSWESLKYSGGKCSVYIDGMNNEPLGYYDFFKEKSWRTVGLLALKQGNHTITFKVTGKNNTSKGYYIIPKLIKFLVQKGPVLLTEKHTLAVGETVTLDLLVSDCTNVDYSSSNPEVALVNKNGTVKALKKGITNITAAVKIKDKTMYSTVQIEVNKPS